MTKEEVIMRGKQLGFPRLSKKSHDNQATMIATIVDEAVRLEREACAKLVEVSDDLADWEIICGSDGRVLLNEMAKAIRARGEQHCCDKP